MRRHPENLWTGSHAHQLDSCDFSLLLVILIITCNNEADTIALVNKVEGDSSKQLLLASLKECPELHAPWISSGKLIHHQY